MLQNKTQVTQFLLTAQKFMKELMQQQNIS